MKAADELLERFINQLGRDPVGKAYANDCAIISLEEMIKAVEYASPNHDPRSHKEYYQQQIEYLRGNKKITTVEMRDAINKEINWEAAELVRANETKAREYLEGKGVDVDKYVDMGLEEIRMRKFGLSEEEITQFEHPQQ